jgi:hypothetical protein
MFPPALSVPTLRSRLVRGLDLAVEFATLGEYGVEDLEVPAESPAGFDPEAIVWEWPQGCGGGRTRAPRGTAPRPRRPL